MLSLEIMTTDLVKLSRYKSPPQEWLARFFYYVNPQVSELIKSINCEAARGNLIETWQMVSSSYFAVVVDKAGEDAISPASFEDLILVVYQYPEVVDRTPLVALKPLCNEHKLAAFVQLQGEGPILGLGPCSHTRWIAGARFLLRVQR